MVEHGTENAGVPSSTLGLSTNFLNLSSTNRTYVPGFEIPGYGSNFGVRWEFVN